MVGSGGAFCRSDVPGHEVSGAVDEGGVCMNKYYTCSLNLFSYSYSDV